MALQLKNKVDKEKKEEKNNGGKYRRKRNVFGKRLFRFGLVGTIIGLIICFAVIKVVFTISQNNKQKKIDADLAAVKELIKQYRRRGASTEKYENVGELIATLPTSFDQQATSLDLDRMVILAGLTESTTVTRKISQDVEMPFKCSVSTIKAVEINLTLYGKQDDVESMRTFLKYITDYDHENFYYVSTLSYSEDRTAFNRSTISIKMYTFYNDIVLTPVVPPNDNTQTTK